MVLRRLIACTVLLAAAALATAQSTPAAKHPVQRKARSTPTSASEREFKKAIQAVQAREFATAEPILKQAAETNPQNYQAWFYLGYVYNATNRRDEAIAAYRKAVALQPQVLESNLNLGMLLAAQGNSEAGRYLRAAGQLKPTAQQQETISKAWLLLAERLEETDFAGASDAYQRASELRPKDPLPLVQFGQLLEKHKDLPGAEKAYQQAIERDPKSSDALAVLANLYLRTNRLPEAEQTLRAFLQANPQSATGHLQLGRTLRAQGKPTEAETELEKALELQPGDPDALKELAAVQVAQKKYAPAEASLRNLTAKSPNDPELHFFLGNVLLHQLKYGDAQAEYMHAVKLKPEWGEAYSELAVAASGNKDYQLALGALQARAKFLPETPGTYFLRATCFDHLRGYEQASEYYHKFLEVADGRFPDQEWQARHRLIAIEPEKKDKKKK